MAVGPNDVAYDAKNLGPGWKREGVLVDGDVDPATKKAVPPVSGKKSWYDTLWGN